MIMGHNIIIIYCCVMYALGCATLAAWTWSCGLILSDWIYSINFISGTAQFH